MEYFEVPLSLWISGFIASEIRPWFSLAAFVVFEIGYGGFLCQLTTGDRMGDQDIEGRRLRRSGIGTLDLVDVFEVLDAGDCFFRSDEICFGNILDGNAIFFR